LEGFGGFRAIVSQRFAVAGLAARCLPGPPREGVEGPQPLGAAAWLAAARGAAPRRAQGRPRARPPPCGLSKPKDTHWAKARPPPPPGLRGGGSNPMPSWEAVRGFPAFPGILYSPSTQQYNMGWMGEGRKGSRPRCPPCSFILVAGCATSFGKKRPGPRPAASVP